MSIYRSFIRNCKNVKVIKISFGRKMKKRKNPKNEMLLSAKKKKKRSIESLGKKKKEGP